MIEVVLLGVLVLSFLNFIFILKIYKDFDLVNKLLDERNERKNEVKTGDVIKQTESLQGYVATPKSKDEVFSGERKYDPSKIKGVFDDFFVDWNQWDYWSW